MVPKLAIGGAIPKPIKLIKASIKIAEGINIVAVTRMGPMALGKRCLNKMVLFVEPMVLAA